MCIAHTFPSKFIRPMNEIPVHTHTHDIIDQKQQQEACFTNENFYTDTSPMQHCVAVMPLFLGNNRNDAERV